ncbi:MAG: H-X9-DG-CTERM domain-containing protein [Armatimonadota bacterium]
MPARHLPGIIEICCTIGILLLFTMLTGDAMMATAAESPDASRHSCLANGQRLIASILQYAQDHHGELPAPATWRIAVIPYVTDEAYFDCPVTPGKGTSAGPADYGYGWWLENTKSGDLLNPALVPVLGDSVTPLLGNSFGARRHDGGAMLAFLDGHVSWLPQGCPHFYANDFEEPATFSVVAKRDATPIKDWVIFSGDANIGNFHDLINRSQHEQRAFIAQDTSGNHILQLTIPAGMTTTYATLPLQNGLHPRIIRRMQYQVEVLIPDLKTCMTGIRIWHAPMTPLTGVMLNGHTGITLGVRSYVPVKGKHPFNTSELKTGTVLRVSYATALSLKEPSSQPFLLSLLPAFGAAVEKGGPFLIPAEGGGSCAVSPENTQVLGLTLAAHPPFGSPRVPHEVTVSFDRLMFSWD